MAIPAKAKVYKSDGKLSAIIEQGELPAGYLEEHELGSVKESYFSGDSPLSVAITKTGVIVGADCEACYAITFDALESLLEHCKKVVK